MNIDNFKYRVYAELGVAAKKILPRNSISFALVGFIGIFEKIAFGS